MYLAAMKPNESHHSPDTCDDAVVEALLAPGKGSFVDALLALADEVANSNGTKPSHHALTGGFQAALARRMRTVIHHEDSARSAA